MRVTNSNCASTRIPMVMKNNSNGSWGTTTSKIQVIIGKTDSPATGAEKMYRTTFATNTMVTATEIRLWAVLETSWTQNSAITIRLTGLECAIMMQLSEELPHYLETITVNMILDVFMQIPTRRRQRSTQRGRWKLTIWKMIKQAQSWFHTATLSSCGQTMASAVTL